MPLYFHKCSLFTCNTSNSERFYCQNSFALATNTGILILNHKFKIQLFTTQQEAQFKIRISSEIIFLSTVRIDYKNDSILCQKHTCLTLASNSESFLSKITWARRICSAVAWKSTYNCSRLEHQKYKLDAKIWYKQINTLYHCGNRNTD